MLNSFIGSESIAHEQPVVKPKAKGVQVLPAGPIPALRPVEEPEFPKANKDLTASVAIRQQIREQVPEQIPTQPVQPPTQVPAQTLPVRLEPELTRVSRPPVPAAASVVDTAKIPALRSTTSSTTLGRATVNMDDLLDQVIHSIVT